MFFVLPLVQKSKCMIGQFQPGEVGTFGSVRLGGKGPGRIVLVRHRLLRRTPARPPAMMPFAAAPSFWRQFS